MDAEEGLQEMQRGLQNPKGDQSGERGAVREALLGEVGVELAVEGPGNEETQTAGIHGDTELVTA